MWRETGTPFGMLSWRPTEQVENHGRAGTHVLFLRKGELAFLHFLEIVTGWLVPSHGQKIPVRRGWSFHRRRSPLLKTGFFREVMELKIQRKNLGNAFAY
jgi:hypothetical protein